MWLKTLSSTNPCRSDAQKVQTSFNCSKRRNIDNDNLENFDVEHDECDTGAFSESEPSGYARPGRTRKPLMMGNFEIKM